MYLVLCIIFSVFAYSAQETVKVSVFYESLCPASQEFIQTQFYPVYQKLGPEALTVKLFPYSQVKVKKSELNIKCQHGEEECFANKIQACALGLNDSNENSINFVGCIMSTDEPQKKSFNKKCARKNKVSWTDIKACINSDQGDTFIYEIYNTTKALTPKLNWVPHIRFNDVFNRTAEQAARENLLHTVCEKYETKKPDGCDEAHPISTEEEEDDF
ncbi:unnamed protein product [Psylliodes chrysocephalus]|uniref:Gamma-interferon-inducible lysosomal thiol reductase n=1 Tax=Psylliodes chrysocephalus TaxID=3402493 RepID=A0A9P0GB27_9CUCU|nr:unnamed protein product [Psylliodes chrysocephala]